MNSGGNMLINEQTRIKDLLSFNQEKVIDALIKLNKNFGKLRNPVLRKIFAGRVNIADACKIAHSPVPDFLTAMKQIGFTIGAEQIEKDHFYELQPPINNSTDYLLLDVRPILANNKDPLKEILAGIKKLKEHQGLKLINTFEPLPLISLLAGKGFSHRVETIDENTVIAYFHKNTVTDPDIKAPLSDNEGIDDLQFDRLLATFAPDKLSYLDVRDLEMPKPMLTILGRARLLNTGNALFVYHKKTPVYLLPELEKQGLKYQLRNESPGNVHMLIYKP